MAARDDIRIALSKLLQRKNDDAFVVIADRNTGKFVQFAGGDGVLHFDLPSQTLDPRETEIAKQLLAEYGIEMDEWELYDQPGGSVVGTQRGFEFDVGGNVEQATEVAWRVLTEVFGLDPGFEMTVEVN